LPSVFVRRPCLPSLPEELRNSWAPSLPGSYPSSSLLRTLPPPSRHPSSSRFQPVIGRTCSRVFLSGTRKVSPVAQHALVTVLSLPPRRSAMPLRSARDMSCRLRPEPGGSAFGSLVFFRGHLWVYFRYGPVTRSPSLRWLCRSASPASLSSAGTTQAKELLTFCSCRSTVGIELACAGL
jgi:hypothetical protein